MNDEFELPSLKTIKEVLLSILPNAVFHFDANHVHRDKYFVYAEEGQGRIFSCDNTRALRTIVGTIDFFTKKEADPLWIETERMLIGKGVHLTLESVQYEKETGFIHYEWEFEVYGQI